MLTPDDLAAFKHREGGTDKLTDQVIEAAELWIGKGRLEIRRNADDTVDEVVASAVSDFHLEQMSSGHWWLGLVADGVLWHINFTSKGKINVAVERLP